MIYDVIQYTQDAVYFALPSEKGLLICDSANRASVMNTSPFVKH